MATLTSQFGFPVGSLYMQTCASVWSSETASPLLTYLGPVARISKKSYAGHVSLAASLGLGAGWLLFRVAYSHKPENYRVVK